MRFFRAPSKEGCSAFAARGSAHPWLLATGVLMLALYFLNYSPAGISLAMLVGSFDSTHEARMRSNQDGMQLVLHHNHGCIGQHHGLVARTLTLFAQPATTGSPDHVIQFSSANNFCSQAQLLAPTQFQLQLPAPPTVEFSIAISNPNLSISTTPRPPPYECGRLACLHSTVFLI